MVNVLRNIVLKVTPKPATGSKKPISHPRPSTGSGRMCPSSDHVSRLGCALSLSKGIVVGVLSCPTRARQHGGELRQHLVALWWHRVSAGEGVELVGLGLPCLLGLVLAAAEEGQGQQAQEHHHQ